MSEERIKELNEAMFTYNPFKNRRDPRLKVYVSLWPDLFMHHYASRLIFICDHFHIVVYARVSNKHVRE